MAEITTKGKQELSKPQEQTRPGRYYVPDVNIYEFDDSLKLWAEMPGVKEKDLDVTLKDGVLTIIGKVATEMYVGLKPRYTEYNVGNYYREFALNESIDESRIKATLRNGVLELELPKKEQAKPKKIEIRCAQRERESENPLVRVGPSATRACDQHRSADGACLRGRSTIVTKRYGGDAPVR